MRLAAAWQTCIRPHCSSMAARMSARLSALSRDELRSCEQARLSRVAGMQLCASIRRAEQPGPPNIRALPFVHDRARPHTTPPRQSHRPHGRTPLDTARESCACAGAFDTGTHWDTSARGRARSCILYQSFSFQHTVVRG